MNRAERRRDHAIRRKRLSATRTDRRDGLGALNLAGNAATGQFMLRETKALAKLAYETQGKEAFVQRRAAAAVHEAGHAVVGTICGETVTRIAVWRNADDDGSWQGITEYSNVAWMASNGSTTPTADFKNAIVTFAGVVRRELAAHYLRHVEKIQGDPSNDRRRRTASRRIGAIAGACPADGISLVS